MQINTTTRFHLIPVRMDIIKKSANNEYWRGCGKKGTPPPHTHTAGGNVSWYSHYEAQYGGSLKI